MTGELEHTLVEHAATGKWLNLAGDEATTEAAMHSWGAERTVPAEAIRRILCGQTSSASSNASYAGELKLRGARITGRLVLDHVHSRMGLELDGCLLAEGISAESAEISSLALANCVVEHREEAPLWCPLMKAAYLSLDKTHLRGNCEGAAVVVMGCELGHLDCPGTTITNGRGPALDMNQMRVDHSVFLNDQFKATGCGEAFGLVNLSGMSLGGRIDFTGATLESTRGTALHAYGLSSGLGVHFGPGFRASAQGEGNAVFLSGAKIELLVFQEAEVISTHAPALNANGMIVHGPVVFEGSNFHSTAAQLATVWLAGAHIGEELRCYETTIGNRSGTAFSAIYARVKMNVVLGDSLEMTGGSDSVTLDLGGVQIDGSLIISERATIDHRTSEKHRLNADGLTYSGLEQIKRTDWLRYLREATADYAAQPYQQLAVLCRRLGHDKEARQVLIAQEDERLRKDRVGGAERAWGWVTRTVIGYGYEPWRAVLYLLGVAAVSVVFALVLGAREGLARTGATGSEPTACSAVESASVGLQLSLPLIKTSLPGHCAVTSIAAGQALTLSGWALQALSWAFATLFVAGFTGAVRKT